MAATTDNSIDLALRAPRGSYIVNKPATDMFPFLKDLASKYPIPKKDLAGGVDVTLTEGETIVPQEMVNDVGLGNLEFFNNKPKEGGHQSIDNIIAFETLQNIKPMSHGGEVQLDNYMGGGQLMNYQDGGQALPEMDIRRNSANLRPSPYMRYERVEGAPTKGDPLYNETRALRDLKIQSGDEPNWFNWGERDGVPFSVGWKDYVESGQGNMRDEMLLDRLLRSERWTGRTYDKSKADIDNLNFLAKKGYQLDEEETQAPIRRLDDALRKDKSLLNNIRRTSSFWEPYQYQYQDGGAVQSLVESLVPTSVMDDPAPEHSHMRGYDPQLARENEELRPRGDLAFIHGGVSRPMKLRDGSYHKPPGLRRLGQEVSPYEESSGDLEKTGLIKKLLGMQQGGPLPNGSAAKEQPNPFVPFDQRPNQAAASGRWGEPGAYMKSLEGAMDSLDMEDSMMTHKKAQNFLNKLRIKGMLQGEPIESRRSDGYLHDGLGLGGNPQGGQAPSMRDISEYFNSQLMQGRDSSAIHQGSQHEAQPPFMYPPRY